MNSRATIFVLSLLLGSFVCQGTNYWDIQFPSATPNLCDGSIIGSFPDDGSCNPAVANNVKIIPVSGTPTYSITFYLSSDPTCASAPFCTYVGIAGQCLIGSGGCTRAQMIPGTAPTTTSGPTTLSPTTLSPTTSTPLVTATATPTTTPTSSATSPATASTTASTTATTAPTTGPTAAPVTSTSAPVQGKTKESKKESKKEAKNKKSKKESKKEAKEETKKTTKAKAKVGKKQKKKGSGKKKNQ